MARLPDVTDIGRRLPQAQRAIVGQQSAGVVAAAVGDLGATVSNIGDAILERESTAVAKERDTLVSDKIRSLLYDPAIGFANLQGQSAVGAREKTLAELEKLRGSAVEGLNATAKRKLEGMLSSRIENAKDTVDRHTSSARTTWLNGASDARIESAYQDSLASPAATAASVAVVESEIRGRASREGWDAAKLDVEMQGARSKVYGLQIERIAASDPIAAMQYLRDNQDSMSPSDVAGYEAKFAPEVKKAVGRAKGQEAYFGTGNMSAALSAANDTLGMNETEQRDALQAYMKDGGVSLDPATTAWCAGIVNTWLANAGIQGTGSNLAKSFLNWGVDASASPKPGDVVVLPRGDPDGIYGHVGLFDGYNPDGTIRVIGGNQGSAGEVSVQSYNAAQVLGIRRAPSDGQAPKGMAALLDIADPLERAAAIDEYQMRVAVALGEQKARVAASSDAAMQHVDSGGDPGALPMDVKRDLGTDGMSGLYSYARSKAAGVPVETDSQTYYDLRSLAASDPAAFSGLNLMQYRGKLSDSDFQKMADMQTTPDKANAVAASTLMELASRQMKLAGIDTGGNRGSADARSVAEMQTRLLVWQDDFIKENRRAPTQTEIDGRIGRELLPVVLNPPGMNNEETSAMFQLRDLDLREDQLAQSSIRIMNTDVPAAVINEQIFALRAEGIPVTAESLSERLVRMFEAAGLR